LLNPHRFALEWTNARRQLADELIAGVGHDGGAVLTVVHGRVGPSVVELLTNRSDSRWCTRARCLG